MEIMTNRNINIDGSGLFIKLLSKASKCQENFFRHSKFFWEKQNVSSFCCFHDVAYENKGPFSIKKDKLLNFIQQYDGKFRSIDDVISEKKNGIVLTFDDGYLSLYEMVYPVLRECGIPFVVYISTDFIGIPGYLTTKHVYELAQNNSRCVIGSHMCSHKKTREMNIEEIKREWIRSKEVLEEITGKEVRHAALPYGSILSCSRRSMDIALNSGYKTVATTRAIPYFGGEIIPRFVYQNNKPYMPIVPDIK